MKQLLDKLIRKGIRLSSANGQLKIQMGNISLSEEESHALKANKEAIIKYLRGRKISCLSFAQERLWFIVQMGYSEQYHISRVVKIKGFLDQKALSKAINFMVSRHESLRAGFGTIDGMAVQFIAEAVDIKIEQMDLSGLSKAEQERASQASIRNFIRRPFDLSKAPLMRVVSIKLGPAEHILGMCLHHIIVDGWSMGILNGEISRVYGAYHQGKEPGLTPLKIQYADYAVWQREFMTESRLDKELGYWKEHLAGYEDLDLPLDYPRPRQLTGRGRHVNFKLKGKETGLIKKLCQERQMTLFTLFTASVYILLRQYSRQEDICIGLPAANRDQLELENLVGFFVNTLVVRIDTGGRDNVTIGQLLEIVNNEIAAGQERQNVPFEKVVETLHPTRDLSRTPIFQVLVNYVNMNKETLRFGESQLEVVEHDNDTAKFDLTFVIAEREEGEGGIYIEYNRDLYREETAARMGRHLTGIMIGLAAGAGKRIDEIELLTGEERKKLLEEWNDTETGYPRDKCIHELFAGQARKSGDNTAVVFEDKTLTYRELDKRSSGLAAYLQKQGIRPDSAVGIFIDRSLEMIVGIMGILKAGGAYVPIDPEYPEARVRYMLADSGSKVLVTTRSLLEERNMLRKWEIETVFPDAESRHDFFPDLPTHCSGVEAVKPYNLSYIIYTSGTTGKPKGTLTKHFNVTRVVKNTNYIRLTGADRVLQLSNYAFDGSVFDIYGALLNGAVLVMTGKDRVPGIDRLTELISCERITLFFVTTALFNALVDLRIDSLINIRKVLFGGERVSVEHVEKALEYLGKDRIIHVYGPTETTVYATYYFINSIKEKSWTIPIGKPISNTSLYILNSNQKTLPIGIAGEIYIGGEGVARGYLNKPELTFETFINYKLQNTNPKLQITNKLAPGEGKNGMEKGDTGVYRRLYRTGDLGRWVPEGNIEFLDRIDSQIKIRGFRIECGEIEVVLTGDPRIQEAVVIAGTINNTRQLIAYYTVKESEKIIETGEIRSRLQEKLPDYMIPAAFVALEAIPLTPNGKVDRKALQKREVEVLSTRDYTAPRTEREKQLTGIWQQVLELKRIGIHDNFFELGGHSLLAARIISGINRELDVSVPLRSLFEAPCIEGLSRVIKELTPGQFTRVGSIKRPEQLPLSYAQERLWYLVQLGYGQQYHVPGVMKIRGDLNTEALQKTFDFILDRHESLRTGFKTIEHSAVQVIAGDAAMGIEHRDLSGLSNEEKNRESQAILREFVHRPFSLENPPLMRVVLIKLEQDVHILGMCLHHIIFDGWSMGILTGEISRAYASYSKGKAPGLAALKIQYADYAVWQREVMTPTRLDNELNWWKQYLSGYEDLQLPLDFPRPGQLSGRGGYVISGLGIEHTRRLKTLCREKQVTLFTVFMTGVYLMLSRYSRQEDICLGFPTANRDHQEIGDLVGFFVNTLVVRIDTVEEEQERLTGEQLLQRVQDNIVAAQDRQNVPFEKVVEILQPHRDLSRSPIFQVLVNYVNIPRETLQLGDCLLEKMDFDYGTAKFDLTAAFAEHENRGININLVYSRDLFAETTIKRMSEHLVKIITGLIDEPGNILDEIALLKEQEKQMLLIDWNDTTAPYPKDKCIHELFEEQVRKGPGKVACILADRHLTYGELDERSTGLAIYLQEQGVRPDVCVGICLERSLEMIIVISGILKAGGAYVPIDAGYPAERIEYMLEDSSSGILVTSGSLEGKVKQIQEKPGIIFIDGFDFPEFSSSHLLNFSTSHPTNLAYVIYTSGSTGKPKGVMVQHDSAVNYLNVLKNRYGFDDMDVGEFNFSFLGNFVFDAVATSFLTPLVSGSACIIYDEQEEQQDIILKALNDPRVQVIKLTPGHIQLIRDCLPILFHSKKIFIIGGESLKKSLVYQLLDNNDEYVYCINQYGPTECTIASTAHLVRRDINYGNEIYIGGPIANTRVYILSRSMMPVPIGVPGELYIGGDGLARGYLNQIELTFEKFINYKLQNTKYKQNTNPKLQITNRSVAVERGYGGENGNTDGYSRVYQSGDLGRRLGDGNIEFLGRIDQQVKIRGFRIECGEIESVLTGHPCIQNAVVLARQINQTRQLAAYLVVDSENKKIETGKIRGYLQDKLPGYMIPVAFMFLESIPLTPSGKVDRRVLLKQEIEVVSSREYTEPRTGNEVRLAKIWAEVLGVDRVGIYDNFFELGGHSLLATRIMSRIKQELKVDVPLRKLFEFPCIEGLSRGIAGSDPVQAMPIASIRRPGQIPLSYAQERLWFLAQLGFGEQYHVPRVVRIRGDLNPEALKKAMNFMANRHESLRTGFRELNGKAFQVIEEDTDIGIENRDLSGLSESGKEMESQVLIRNFVQAPFELEKPPLMRVILIRLDSGTHILGICLHHIISDGWSGGILTGEISRAYAAYCEGREPDIEPLTIQYADYAVWQREVMTEAKLDIELKYWKEQLRGYEDLDLPTDFPRPGQVSGKGGFIGFRLPTLETRQLKERCQKYQVTLFTVFTACVYLLLRQYSRQEDICLGMPVANRNFPEIENLVGFFVNTLVVRIDTGGQVNIILTIEQLLKKVKQVITAAQDRQNVPFEKIVEVIRPTRDLSRTPIFQVLINHVNTRREKLRFGDCQLDYMGFDYEISKFDLLFDLSDREDGSLGIAIQFSRALFAEGTIERMGRHLIKIINCFTEEPGQAIDEIELLTGEEKQKLLCEWNDTATDYSWDRCLHGLFMEQAVKTPLKAAVMFADQILTYGELDKRSSLLAMVLKKQGIMPDDLVGVCLERSLETIVGILGILKGGGAYMPIDVDYPETRIKYMIAESNIRVLLTSKNIQDKLKPAIEEKVKQQAELSLQFITVEAGEFSAGESSSSFPVSALTSDLASFTPVSPVNLSYIIYTSGSTGKPKGVMQTHRTIANLIAFQRGEGVISRDDQVTYQRNVAQFAAHGFDVSIQEIFYALLEGDVLYVVPGEIKQSPAEVVKFVSRRQINILYLPTAYLEYFAEEVNHLVNIGIKNLERIIVAGEALKISSTIKEFFSTYSHIGLENQYGPSEMHVVTRFILPGDTDAWSFAPPIGKPIANIRIYILNRVNRPVPLGIPGELHLSGDGIARGYLNNPTLTSKKFRPHVINKKFLRGFHMFHGQSLQKEPPCRRRQYRTGDLCRWLPERSIEFLGRIDRQVKVRGFRVECGEIEAELVRYPGIREVVVIDRVINDTTQLIAFYVVEDRKRGIEVNELRSYLQVKLPEYMVPGAFVSIGEIPLNANGKVDRKYLSRLEVELGGSREYVAPGTGLERRLVRIWEEVLGAGPVGIYDNFFQLGGHSLLAIQIISRIKKELGAAVPLRSIFEAPYIASLAGVIPASSPGRSVPIGSLLRPERIPLSYAQERLWFLAQLGYSEQYHIPEVMKITGSLDEDVLQKAIDFILERHESLRTGFKAEAGMAFQVIEPVSEVRLEIEKIDLQELKLNPEKQERESQDIIREFIRKPFDPGQAPLMRVILIKLDDRKYIWGMCQHHIIFDGWSIGILIREISQAYAAILAGEESGLAELTIQYADYAVWQREVMNEEQLDRESGYWQERLAGYEDLDMPGDYPRPRQVSGKGGRVKFGLDGEESRQLKEFCRERQITMYTVLLTGVYLLLRRYSRQEDICLGMPAANRNLREIEDLIGFFVNTLVIRIDTGGRGDMPVERLLGEVHSEIVAAQDRQDVSFARIVEALQPTRDLSRSPIFQVLVNYVNVNLDKEELRLGDSQLEGVEFDYSVSKFDLTFGFSSRGDGSIGAIVEYSRDLFREESIARLGGHLLKILIGLVEEPGNGLDEIELLSDAERHTLLVEWNNTATNYGYLKDKCLHDLFLEQAVKTLDRTAVVFVDETLSYGELAARSAGLAGALKDRGIGPDSPVGICMERSLEMMVALLGILMAGGAYMPVDTLHPGDRIGYMIEDSNARILVTSGSLEEKVKEIKGNAGIILIDDFDFSKSSSTYLLNSPTSYSTHLAYVIYTSGSTGKPKGVMVEHRAICNRIVWMQEQYCLTGEDAILQKTPYSFDVSVWEFFWPVMAGARLILALPGQHREPDSLAGLIEKERITTLHFVPSMLRAFLEVENLTGKVSCLKRIICSGEALSIDLQDNCLSLLDCELHNLYGPTEAAVDVSYWACRQDYPGGVPIGRPIANIRLYILDSNLKPVPIGVPGELHIGGVGLGRGYLNQPGLTAEKFINYKLQNTKYKQNTNPKLQIIYRTGDLTRWLGDGNIEYLGRIDFQVKIRGFRIESGEIEMALSGHPGIREAVVIASDLNNTTQLAAYFIAHDRNNIPEAADIRRYLQDKLPEYMIPTVFVALEQIPLTPNGKVDRKALGKLEIDLESSHEYVAPRTVIEKQLARIWEEVLGIERVGIQDNFFELGGHSLLATRIISRIQKELEVDISLSQLFEAPTIRGICRLMAESNPYRTTDINPVQRSGPLPLSYAQERLWFLVQMGYGEQYHIPKVIQINGDLDEKALQKTINFIAIRHESLRTSFKTIDGQAVQFIEEPTAIVMEKKNLSGVSTEEQEQEKSAIIHEFVQRPFDPGQAPLIRVVLIKLGVSTHILGMCLHHLTADAWSMGILMKDITRAYAAYRQGEEPGPEALKIQYADFAVWQRQVLNEEKLENMLISWKKHLAGYENLDMPGDFPRPKQLSGTGGHVIDRLETDRVQPLKNLCRYMRITLFTVFMTGTYILLRRYSRQEDICLGFPAANRNRQEIEDIVGFFLNTLVVRVNAGEQPGIRVRQLLERVHQEIVTAQDRQDVPFEKVVEAVQPSRDLSRTPIFQVLVNYVNAGREELQLGDSHLQGVDYDYAISKFDLTFAFVDQTDGGIRINVEYSRDLYQEETIKGMIRHLIRIMSCLPEETGKAADEITLLTAEEKHKLLVEWNDTTGQYPGHRCIHELFREQVRKSGDTIALVFEDQTISYCELEVRSTALAAALQKQGVRPDSLVGICLERSLEMVVGLMGILIAGGAYVPLDPDYPSERLEYMLRDSNVSLVLTQTGLTGKISLLIGHTIRVMVLDYDWQAIEKEIIGEQTLKPVIQSNNAAYAIYTSGSTGKPKGVMIAHRALTNFLIAMSHKPGLNCRDKLLAVTTYCFDIAGLELYLPLIKGAQSYICNAERARDAELLKQVIHKIRPTIMQATPATWTMLFYAGWKNQEKTKILCGGEALPEALRQHFLETHSDSWNMFGPTETTIWSTIQPITGEEPITIGKPIANTRIYILDSRLKPSPIGTPGELYIAGDGLARGYLNRVELTFDKFINYKLQITNESAAGENGIGAESEENGGSGGTGVYLRLYRTGDLARWRFNGNIEFLGRLDHQVKVRGFRIECGEIESVLVSHPHIREAVVLARDLNNSTQLVAYYVPGDKENTPDTAGIRDFLRDKLPDYMIPGAFVSLETIPLTPNGKVDRKSLLKLEVEVQSSREYVAPATETEKQLAAIWEEILGVEKVGIYDNFFELGGHSLLVIRMVTMIRQRLGVECPVKNIFDHVTVHELAALFQDLPCQDEDNMTHVNIRKRHIKNNTFIPLGEIQFMLWLFWKAKRDTWNLWCIYDVKGPINNRLLEQAFNVLLERHESLRACLSVTKPVQKITPHRHIPLSVIDLRGQSTVERQENLEKARQDVIEARFDLTAPPLIRLCLVHLEDFQYKLLAAAPHIVVDNAALYTLFGELIAFYRALASGQVLPGRQTDIELSDFVYWQHQAATQARGQCSGYWRQKLAGASLLDIPQSYLPGSRPASPTHLVRLDSSLLASLAKISLEQNVSLQMSLFAVIAIVLNRITFQDDLSISIVFENRLHQEIRNLAAPMVTAVPIRIRLTLETTFARLMVQVKHTTLEAYDHLQGSSIMPLMVLSRSHRQKKHGFMLKFQARALRFITWLLSRLWLPGKTYPTLFYAVLMKIDTKPRPQKIQTKKSKQTKSDASSIRDSIPVALNFMPDFYQGGDTTDHNFDIDSIDGIDKIDICPGTLPISKDSRQAVDSEQANTLYLAFSRDQEGSPLLWIKEKRFTPTALQQIAASFEEVLRAVVKNPHITLQELNEQQTHEQKKE